MLAGARADDHVLALGPLGIGTKRAMEAMTATAGSTVSSPFPTYGPRYAYACVWLVRVGGQARND